MTGRRLAYADPPYPGQARRYRDGREVNLPLLVAYLRTFDGWALSTSASALRVVWNCCPEARCAAWVKTHATNGFSRVRWTWEPVLFVTDHRGQPPGARSVVWDSLVAAPIHNRLQWRETPDAAGGEKPHLFTRWLLELLDHHDGDTFTDVFPGSGAVGASARYDALQLELEDQR